MFTRGNHSVNVDRFKLLTILKKNRENHKKVYDLAVADYKNEKIKLLEEALEKVRSEEDPMKSNLSVTLTKPVSHLNEYDEVIDMLSMSVDNTINLDNSMFQAYIKDNWSWKSSFALTNSKYLAAAGLGS